MHPQLLPGAGTAILALCQVHTAQQNTSLNQGQRLPDLETIIIGGRQAECVYPPSQYAAMTTKPGDPCGCTQGSQPQKGFSGVPPEPTFGDFCLDTKVTRARGAKHPPPRQRQIKATGIGKYQKGAPPTPPRSRSSGYNLRCPASLSHGDLRPRGSPLISSRSGEVNPPSPRFCLRQNACTPAAAGKPAGLPPRPAEGSTPPRSQSSGYNLRCPASFP